MTQDTELRLIFLCICLVIIS